MRLILTSHPPDYSSALTYARTVFPPFYPQHEPEIRRLMTCMLYLPLARLQLSPYAELASPSLHSDLEPMFAKEYCASLGMSKQIPLRVIGDIGGGGALARIEKGRKVMRERKSEWSRTDELPVECYVSSHSQFFACLHQYPRLKYPCRRRTDIIPYLHVRFRKNSRQNRIHQ